MLFGGMFDEPKRNRPKFTPKDKIPHYKHQGGKCNGCKKKFAIENLTVDHIKAFSKGGQERTSNTRISASFWTKGRPPVFSSLTSSG